MKEFEVQRIKPKIKPIVEERLLDLLTGTDPANSSTYASGSDVIFLLTILTTQQ